LQVSVYDLAEDKEPVLSPSTSLRMSLPKGPQQYAEDPARSLELEPAYRGVRASRTTVGGVFSCPMTESQASRVGKVEVRQGTGG